MKHSNEEDGWDSTDFQETRSIQELPIQFRYNFKDAPRDILDPHHHSLQPDMALGWKPKLPSCPLPLSYNNIYLDTLTTHLPSDDRFKLVYFGPRYTNSVQLNQQYNYYWRYRSRYNTTINVVKQAIKRVGEDGRRVILQTTKNQIEFDSSFEGGNLDMAVRVKPNQFDLFLRCDTNTKGHTAWFYFKVDNKDFLGELQLNICNFGKRKNLYACGMKPYVLTGDEWKQEGCYDVHFVQRICRYGFDKKTFQLQFKYNFNKKHQSVYFAYAIPYTYSKLQTFITQTITNSSRYVKSTKLCQTLGGLDVPLLTVTNTPQGLENADQNINTIQERKKKTVLVTARIHPGQSHSSYLMQGFIKFLVSEHPSAQQLRSCFVFYIVPMLNPDGVVAGNFRTSFSGKDLNRQFNKLNKSLFPEITALHDLAIQLKGSYRSGFQFYFDFHAHSSKRGLFCYGPQHQAGNTDYFRSRALAKLIEQKTPIFCYHKSIFTISEHKKTTGRAHMLSKVKVPMTFTFQVSNGLYQTKSNRNVPLTEQVLIGAGSNLIQGFMKYYQLQMRLPSVKIRAKVDTGINTRKGLSAKEFRKSTSKNTTNNSRTLTLKNIQDIQELGHTSSSRGPQRTKQTSIKDLIDQNQIQQRVIEKSSKKEFLQLIQQIKRQELQLKDADDYEGGSDSQSESDDLDQKELAKLHKIIENRNQGVRHYSKGHLQWKNQQKKVTLKKQSQSQQTNNINKSEQLEGCKKAITSKYLKPLKNSGLPPRVKKLPYICTQKEALVPKNFDIIL